MISIDEAYALLKKYDESPMTYIMMTDKYFLSDSWNKDKGFPLVDKETGEVKFVGSYLEFLPDMGNEKMLFYGKLFEDFIIWHRQDDSEKRLADAYTMAWNRLFYHKQSGADECADSDTFDRIIAGWSEIEQELYGKIRDIIDNEDIDYPPCVLNKFSDPFYRIKPFMLRNGYTDNDANRTWVRE